MDPPRDLTSRIVELLDVVLGGLLNLPRDLTLVIVALITVGLIVAVRRLVTNQNQLRRCAADLKRLKQLRREARAAGDRPAVARITRTTTQVKLLQLKGDLVVLAVVLAPLALLATWAVARLDFLPARVAQPLELTAYFPLSSVDRLTHLVPRSAMELRSPPIQRVVLDDEDPRQGRARWVFEPREKDPEFELIVRHAGETAVHPVLVGSERYAPVLVEHPGNQRLTRTHVSLARYKFLGLDPRLERYGLAPWLVAYVVLSLILTPIIRRVFRVA